MEKVIVIIVAMKNILFKKNTTCYWFKTLYQSTKRNKKIQESIDTLKSFNREKSIKRAESKEKQLAKIERIDRPENLPSAITVQFTPAIESGYDVLKVTDLSMRYDQMVFEHCNLDIKKVNVWLL